MPQGGVGMVGLESPSSQHSGVPPNPWPLAFPGITAWLPWCTTDSACDLTTLSMTVSPSTTLQVSLDPPHSLQHSRSLGSPLLGRQKHLNSNLGSNPGTVKGCTSSLVH